MNDTSIRSARWSAGALGAWLLLGGLAPAAHAQQPSQGGAPGVETANFDTSVRPQDDFYRYVNGGWLKSTRIPEDRSNYGAFTELADESEAALRTLIEEAAAARARPGSDAQKVGDFYASFMDTARIESLGLRPLQPELRRIAGARGTADLPALFARMQRLGVQTPFSFYVTQDAKQADRYVAYLSQSGLGLPDRDYYFNPDPRFAKTRQAYADYIETLLRLAGEEDPADAAGAVMNLETWLATHHWDRTRNRDREATYNRYTAAQLGELAPGFGWRRYLGATGGDRSPAVVVRQPDFFQALDRILAETPAPVWRQYLTFKLLDAYAGSLSREFVDAQFAFRGRELQGLEENRPRWKRAVGAVEDALGMVAGRMYVERHFSPEAKARMETLVQNLVAAFREGIDSLEWMSPETRAQAQDKLAKFNVKIGYPDRWPDHAGLEVRRDDLVGNVMRASQFEFQRMASRLGRPIDRDEWFMTPQTVNAYYSPSMNEIVFPAAILQPPFFNLAADDAVNYGAIGGVIGHEISHGFDDQGRRSDGDGNLRDWWTGADAQAFESRANRLVEQYGAYEPLEGMSLNGRLTLGENIGDLSGLAVAYQAYRKSLQGKEAPVLGGFTGDQRFYLGWAQMWRRLYREEELRQRLLTDSHSPSEYRVNAVLMNQPAFHEAFNVQPGDGMYLPPEQRVTIW